MAKKATATGNAEIERCIKEIKGGRIKQLLAGGANPKHVHAAVNRINLAAQSKRK